MSSVKVKTLRRTFSVVDLIALDDLYNLQGFSLRIPLKEIQPMDSTQIFHF